jgi:hypothetical protein
MLKRSSRVVRASDCQCQRRTVAKFIVSDWGISQLRHRVVVPASQDTLLKPNEAEHYATLVWSK